ncbi:MAG: AMP-binding protein [Clostridia bacterium]|nr:AMP-binding protein [Clostridia bacterium]
MISNKKHVVNPSYTFTNVRDLVEWAAKERPESDRYAFSYRTNPHDKEATRISYTAFRDDVRALSSEFLARGWQGKHICIIGKASYEWVLVYYAAMCTNSVLVPLDRDWTKEDLADTVAKAKTNILICDSDIPERCEYISEHVSLDEAPYLISTKEGDNTVKALLEAGRVKFNENTEPYFATTINPQKMSLLVFTSGTTGKGKGVMHCQNAILSDIYNALHYIDYGRNTISVLPPHHTFGSTIMFIGHVMIGTEVYLSSGIRYVANEIKDVKPEHLILVPLYLETFYRKILANLDAKGKTKLVFRMMKVCKVLRFFGIDIRRKVFKEILDAFGGNLRMAISGSAPLSREILDFYHGIGITLLNGYGITECAPLISVNRSKNNVIGSIGNVIDDCFVKIDEPNEDGEGEILFKGQNVMLGYYENDEATADAFKDGYFRTGDYGKLDKNGVLYITGRKKNLIILSNGKNVYPEEIENELATTPGIQDIIVYEGKSKRGISYNNIVAEIYPEAEFIEKNGITDAYSHFKPFIDEYNKYAVPYKKIGILKIRTEEFPKNTLRKIMRFKLDTTID